MIDDSFDSWLGMHDLSVDRGNMKINKPNSLTTPKTNLDLTKQKYPIAIFKYYFNKKK